MLANSGLSTTEPIPKTNTRRAYAATLSKFISEYGNRDIHDLSSDKVLSFLNKIAEGNKPQTKKIRYAHLSSFFNFIRNNIDQEFRNPCDNPMIRKLSRTKIPAHWDILEKETVDEIIFRTTKARNRLMLELIARGG
jgi:integrase/recombinase XerD